MCIRDRADALLVITPYYNKPNETGMLEHFYTIADNVNIPIYIYNVPARTGICISPEIVAKLSRHKNIAGIKEASGDISYVAKLSRLIDDDFSIYSGNDDITVALMSMGAAAVSYTHLPGMMFFSISVFFTVRRATAGSLFSWLRCPRRI